MVLGVPLVWLLAVGGPEFRTRPLERWARDDDRFRTLAFQLRSLPMERRAEEADGFAHTVEFAETEGLPREGLRSIELLFDVRKPDDLHSEEKRVTRLMRGEVRHLETGEVWTARPMRRFETEDRVVFERVRGAQTAPLEAENPGSRNASRGWSVTLWTHDPVGLAVRCHLSGVVPDGPPPRHPGEWVFRVPAAVGEVQWAYPHGRYTVWTEAAPMSRARVLGALWDRRGAAWVWGWIALALGMVVTGVGGMAGRDASGLVMRPWRAGLSLGLVFGGLGLVQLILHPPFQGLGETAQVLSWQSLVQDGESRTNVIDFGRRVHHDRLVGRPDQQFTTADVGDPYPSFVESARRPGAWTVAPSATAGRVSSFMEWWVGGMPPAAQVFRLRWVGLVLVSLAVVLAGVLMVRGSGAQAGEHWLGWCFVMVPSLGYFAMGASVEPLQLACTVVLGAALAAMINRGEPSWWVMLLVGMTLGVLGQTSVAGALTAAGVGIGLIGLAMFRSKEPAAEETDMASQLVGVLGWGALVVGLLVARVISTDAYDGAMGTMLQGPLARIGWNWIPPYWCAVVVGCGGLWAVERMVPAMRGSRSGSQGRRLLWLEMLALAILLGLCWNALRSATQFGMLTEAVPVWESLSGQERLLPPIGLPAPAEVVPTRGAAARGLVESFLSSWGPGDADHMTSVLFWQLDGRRDTFLPGWVRQFLTTMLGCGLALSLWRISERRNRGRLGKLAMVLVGVGVALVLIAFGSLGSKEAFGVHGGTLLGIHVLLIPVLFLGWKGLMVRWEMTSPRKLGIVLVLPMLLMQAAAILTTIRRYLG
jgi:hypothetical protein